MTHLWEVGYAQLPQAHKDLISLVMDEELNAVPMNDRKHAKKLVRVCQKRLLNTGIVEYEACSRCGGTGRHDYCEAYGTMCFGCNGAGKWAPSVGKCLTALKKWQKQTGNNKVVHNG